MRRYLKVTWAWNFTPPFMAYFCNFIEKEPCTRFCGTLVVRFYEFVKSQCFEFRVSDVIPANIQNNSHWFSLYFFASFMEKKPPIKLHGHFDHFSRPYEAEKFWMIEMYLDVSDVIHGNGQTKHGNCGLWQLCLLEIFINLNLFFLKKW